MNGKSCTLVISAISHRSSIGRAQIGGSQTFACALGRTGRRYIKRECDGATPIGQWTIDAVLYRRDKIRRPATGLPVRTIKADDGWCDDPKDRNYNRAVTRPYRGRHERLYRDDNVYDIILILSHNRRPRIRNHGSAIFAHLARPGFEPTEGCIALNERDLRHVLAHCSRGSRIIIKP